MRYLDECLQVNSYTQINNETLFLWEQGGWGEVFGQFSGTLQEFFMDLAHPPSKKNDPPLR